MIYCSTVLRLFLKEAGYVLRVSCKSIYDTIARYKRDKRKHGEDIFYEKFENNAIYGIRHTAAGSE